jgi:hypothetical protein
MPEVRRGIRPHGHALPIRILATALWVLAAGSAVGGPPYTTDDPEPTPAGHWENRIYFSGVQSPGDTLGQSGFDINYGAANDLQLTLLAPLDYDHRSHTAIGSGDVQVAAKYRFIHQSDHTILPDVSFFPALILPTQGRAFGPARLGLFLPLWAQKDFGDWSTFGGGGYEINPGPGNRNFTLTGWAVTRQLTKRLNLGLEVYHQTPDTIGSKSLTAAAVGAVYQISKHFAVMGSAGPALQQARQAGQGVFYVALQFTN